MIASFPPLLLTSVEMKKSGGRPDPRRFRPARLSVVALAVLGGDGLVERVDALDRLDDEVVVVDAVQHLLRALTALQLRLEVLDEVVDEPHRLRVHQSGLDRPVLALVDLLVCRLDQRLIHDHLLDARCRSHDHLVDDVVDLDWCLSVAQCRLDLDPLLRDLVDLGVEADGVRVRLLLGLDPTLLAGLDVRDQHLLGAGLRNEVEVMLVVA